ncbi:alpha-2-macroglobulin-like protein 1, partial [Clarias magur]
FYLLAMTSQTVGGTTETICITASTFESVSMHVTLEYNQNTISLLTEKSIIQEYYNCFLFQVPVVNEEVAASINIQFGGSTTLMNKTAKILIRPSTQLTIIETDRPIYKPGETVKFRIVSLDTNFLTYNQTFPTIDVQDPNSHHIGQWLDVATQSGLVDLSHPLNSEAVEGLYLITVRNKKNNKFTQTFEVKDYDPSTFEVIVQLPPLITIQDMNATLKACAKYTYGKPVNGTVQATVCRSSHRQLPQGKKTAPDICKIYKMKTDRTGCGLWILKLNEFALTDSRYNASINVHSRVEEDGTGVIVTGSASCAITANMVMLSFEDSPKTFKLGMAYEGMIKVTRHDSKPSERKAVYLTVRYSKKLNTVRKLVTNYEGVAKFSLLTDLWGLEPVLLQAKYETTDTVFAGGENQLAPYYPTASLSLQPFYSKSLSFIKIRNSSMLYSCNKNGAIRAQYMIHNSALRPNTNILSFFYMVMNKGHLVQQGRIVEAINPGSAEHKGNLVLTMQMMLHMTPVAQVVLYTILPSGEVVADSANLKVQLCLANKVSLNFSPSTALPGAQTSLVLRAAPGSLCSVKAIDQSLLRQRPQKELNIQHVFNMLPVQTLSGYSPKINDEDPTLCSSNPYVMFAAQALKANSEKVDVYSTFKYIGVQMITNADVRNLSGSVDGLLYMKEALAPVFVTHESSSGGSRSNRPAVLIHKHLLNTWIWDLYSISDSGVVSVNKTVPDSITMWQAGAFCTSPVGFGVAPSTELAASQPFSVSLHMPSSVIRGEVFTLKATVLNTLHSCVMVKVTLADSQKFSAHFDDSISYTHCLCAEESWIFSWTITPLVLGKVSVHVSAEAVQASCEECAVSAPLEGYIDSITKTLLVQAEGTAQSEAHNMLLCPPGVVEKTVSLTLPSVFVNGSAVASVSVMGDLMGKALHNLVSLLAKPNSRGDQNMMLFTPNIFILEYLTSTNQLMPEIRTTAEAYLMS